MDKAHLAWAQAPFKTRDWVYVNVLVEGQAVTRALDMMVSNNKNTPPSPLMQPVGMPPLPTRPKAPHELEPEGPDRINAIIQGDPGEGMGILIGETDE